jgi:hypothetical protein
VEVYDSVAKEWFPADPSSGLVGTDQWMKGRVAFGKRATLNPLTEDMIVPFAIFAADAEGKFTINRTQHYLVEQFIRLYKNEFHDQRAWQQWTAALDFLDGRVAGAFAGNVNLHDSEAEIDSLALTYEELRAIAQETTANPIFIFHPDEFWLNLHHFLYVLGRSENKTLDSARKAVVGAPADQDQGLAKLHPEQRVTWREAVSFYAKELSRKRRGLRRSFARDYDRTGPGGRREVSQRCFCR